MFQLANWVKYDGQCDVPTADRIDVIAFGDPTAPSQKRRTMALPPRWEANLKKMNDP